MGNAGNVWNTRWFVAAGVLLVVTLAAAACGGGNGGGGSSILTDVDPPAFDAQAALDEVTGTEPTDGIDAAVWDELTAELERSITVRGAAAAPPAGTLVEDLAANYNPDGSVELTWTYHNAGDYDLNGMVNVSDLTTVGIYYGVSSADENWPAAMVADGNGNGLIDIGDITPIGQHYETYLTEYSLQYSSDDGEDVAWSELGTVPLSAMVPPEDGGMPRFSYTPDTPPPAGYLSVVPMQGEGEVCYTRSVRMNVLADIWGDYGRTAYRHCASPYLGPENPAELWRLELDGSPVWSTLVIGPNGDLYTAGSAKLVSVNPEGTINWEYTSTGGNFNSRPVVTHDGIIHIINNESILEIDASGTLVDSHDSPFPGETGWTENNPVRGPQGNYYGSNAGGEFIKAGPAGDVLWSYTMTGDSQEYLYQVIFSPDYIYLLFGSDYMEYSDIQCMDYNGNVIWNHAVDDYEYYDVHNSIADDASRLYVGVTEYFVGYWEPRSALIALDTTGNQRWMIEEGNDYAGMPLGINGNGNLVLNDLRAHCLTLDTDGNEVARGTLATKNAQLPSDLYNIPVLPVIDGAGNTYRAYSGRLDDENESIAVWLISDTATGERRWAMHFDDVCVLESSPCLGAGGVLYFMDENGTVIAVGESANTAIDPPANVRASEGLFPDRIEVSWDPDPGAIKYLVYRGDCEVPIAATDTVSWIDSGIPDHAPYSYRVAIMNNRRLSEPSAPAIGWLAASEGSPGPADWAMADGDAAHRFNVSIPGPQLSAVVSSTDCSQGFFPNKTVFGSDGKAYVCDGNSLYSYLADGTHNWEMEIPCTGLRGPVIGAGGVVYLVASNFWDHDTQQNYYGNCLMAISSTREILWKYKLFRDSQYLCPVIAPDGRIILDCVDGMLAINPADGSLAWAYNGLFNPAVADDGTVYGIRRNPDTLSFEGISALDAAGNLLWEHSRAVGYYLAVGSDGNVYTMETYKDYSTDPATPHTVLVSLTPAGALAWELDVEGTLQNPVFTGDGKFYCMHWPDQDGSWFLECYNPATQTREWNLNLADTTFVTCLATDGNGTVYIFKSEHDWFQAVDSTGSLVAELQVDEIDDPYRGLFATIAPSGELYVVDRHDRLTVIE